MKLRTALLLLFFLTAVPVFGENVVLTGGTIVDGSGKPGARGNVRIRDGKIVEIGAFTPASDDMTIDVRGLIVAPGFIDIHNHSVAVLENSPGAVSQIRQGVSTLVVGLDGEGPVDVEGFMSRFDSRPPALNLATLIGYTTSRRLVLGRSDPKPASPAELKRMEDLVELGMRQGAFGLSVSFESVAGNYGTPDELVALSKVVARYGGIVVCEIRSDSGEVLDSVRKAIEVGRLARVPIQITQLKLAGQVEKGKASDILAEIDKARAAGVDVAVDINPYTSWSAPIESIAPGIQGNVQSASRALVAVGGPKNVMVVRSDAHPSYTFKTIDEIAAGRKVRPEELFNELVLDGDAIVVVSSLADSDVKDFIRHPWVMVSSGGSIGDRHPRGAGAFVRVLAAMVRDDKTLTIEAAVRKMSALPAARFGFKGRGILEVGAIADVAIFDPLQVRDRATLREPGMLADGMRYVFVNGVMTIKDGEPTDARPGRAMR